LSCSGIAGFIGAFNDTVTTDEVPFRRVRVEGSVESVSNGSRGSEDRGEEEVDVRRQVADDDRGRGTGVTSGRVVSVADQSDNFVISRRVGDISGTDDGTADVLLANAFEGSVSGNVNSFRSHAEIEREVERAVDASGGQVGGTDGVAFQVGSGDLEEGEDRASGVLVSVGSGVQRLVSDRRARGERSNRDVVVGREVESVVRARRESDDGDVISRASSQEQRGKTIRVVGAGPGAVVLDPSM